MKPKGIEEALSRIQRYLSLIDDWTKANSDIVIIAVIGVLITPIPAGWAVNWSGLSHADSSLQIVHISDQTPAYDNGTYSDVAAAVQNASAVEVQRCSIKAYNHLLFSQDIDENSILGSTEQFDLSPQEGLVKTVSVYLPTISGEAMLGGGIRASIDYRFECENADYSDYGGRIVVFP
jgi:hypothetical protein